MLLALPVWNGRISPVFDVARQFLLLTLQDGKLISREERALPGTDPLSQVTRLAETGAEVLICGAIARPLAELVSGKGIRLIAFVAGDVEGVISAFLKGDLPGPAWAMPGCRGRGHGCRGHGSPRVHRSQKCRAGFGETPAKAMEEP